MSPTFSPAQLTAARELRGMTKTALARAVGCTAGAISHFENPERAVSPSELTLQRLAQALTLPVSALQVVETVTPPDESRIFYRRRQSISKRDRRSLERRAAYRGYILQTLCELVGTPAPTASLPELRHLSPEEGARELRRFLGMDARGPVGAMELVLDALGVDMHILPNGTDHRVDAFSFLLDGQAVIVQNPSLQNPRRDRFTTSHELKHILVDHSVPSDNRQQEKEANQFAAEFLVPAAQWRREAPRYGNLDAYRTASRRWGVSIKMLLYRSRTLSLLTERQYRRAMMRYSSLGWQSGEPEKDAAQASVHIYNDHLRLARRMGITISQLGAATELGDLLVRECLGPLATLLEDGVAPTATQAPQAQPAPNVRRWAKPVGQPAPSPTGERWQRSAPASPPAKATRKTSNLGNWAQFVQPHRTAERSTRERRGEVVDFGAWKKSKA